MKVSILGAGAYGIALSKILVDNGMNVIIWTKVQDEYDMLTQEHCNNIALPSFKIDKSIKITMNMEEAIKDAKVIFVATSIKFIKDVLLEAKKYYKKGQHVCMACKGITEDDLSFGSEMAQNILKSKKIGVISGGTFANDMVMDNLMGLVISSHNKSTSKIINKCICNKYIKTMITSDVLGVELCGAIKNVIAIACGIMDGENYSESTKSMFFTIFLNELVEMIYYLGGYRGTILNYAGIGDLWLTCTSSSSRNYTLGLMIGNKQDKKKIDEYIKNSTVEGFYTLNSIYLLLKRKKYRVKFIDILYEILYKDGNSDLFLNYFDK